MDELFSAAREDYGDLYYPHLLEQYKLYIELMDRVSQRRAVSNTFFLAVNSLIVTVLGLIKDDIGNYSIIISVLGLILSYTWYYVLHSYRLLNSGKFAVIHDIEEKLPLALFKYEWAILGYGKNRAKYWPISHIEKIVPAAFGIAYIILAVAAHQSF